MHPMMAGSEHVSKAHASASNYVRGQQVSYLGCVASSTARSTGTCMFALGGGNDGFMTCTPTRGSERHSNCTLPAALQRRSPGVTVVLPPRKMPPSLSARMEVSMLLSTSSLNLNEGGGCLLERLHKGRGSNRQDEGQVLLRNQLRESVANVLQSGESSREVETKVEAAHSCSPIAQPTRSLASTTCA
jgi:hypothetical protein